MAGSNGRARPADGFTTAAGAAAENPRSADAPLHEIITSDFAAGFEIQQRIVEAVQHLGYGSEEIFALKISVEEALVNAIKHGNKLNKSKRVQVDASFTAELVKIEIQDDGDGFDRASIPNPLADENIEKPSGRGILLIESYMSDVHWTLGGRRLHMVKRRGSRTAASES